MAAAAEAAGSRVEMLHFFSDSSQWWDKRFDKENHEAPDFEHKTIKKALWINGSFSPPWLHKKLATVTRQVPNQMSSCSSSSSPSSSSLPLSSKRKKIAFGKSSRREQLWQEFFSDPSQWWDNRPLKKSPKHPDFKHKSTHESLWIEGWMNPPWVKAKIATMPLNRIQSSGGLKSQGFDSFENGDNVRKLCEEGQLKDALHMVELMVQKNNQPPINAFISLLKGCTRNNALAEGKRVHGLIVQSSHNPNIFVRNILVDMYAKCGSVLDAEKVFSAMPKRNVFSWTAIISAYADHGQAEEAIQLFQKMQQTGIVPDKVAFLVVLKACARIASLEQGKQLHSQIIKSGFESDVALGSSLVDMYAKCGGIEYAREVFNKLSERDVVLWNAMISGYAQQGLGKEALALHQQMKQGGVMPSIATYVVLLKACTGIAALEQGKQLHSQIIQSGFDVDVVLGNTLVDMYAKCGSIEDAHQAFRNMHEKDVVSWNVMITGYALQGHGKEALTLFEEMQSEGTKPNEATFVSLLSACSHSGLVDEGRQLFASMYRDHGVTPNVDHYACMVVLLGRAGCLADAEYLVHNMPIQPDAVVWMALLGAARNHGHLEIGRHAFDCAVKLEPENVSAYVLLSNIYAAAGNKDEVAKIRKEMRDVGVQKKPGCSWIEVDNQVHSFIVGDATHPQSKEIRAELVRLMELIKMAGYIPDVSFVLHAVEDEEKENALCEHSEKLALAFGLLNTPPGTPIRINKNLRVCGDCHNATKLISKVVEREIIARDANRFHHFKDGFCSCGDYW